MAPIPRAISSTLAMSFMLLTLPAWGEDMGTHRATYEIHLEDIMLDHSKKLNELPNKYAGALVALKAKFQKEGSLTKIKRILAEMERFEKTKSMPEEGESDELQEIRNLQTISSNQETLLKNDKASAIISLTKQYDRALGNYQKTLVQAGKFDDANKVEEERKRAKKSTIYLRAKAILSGSAKETVSEATKLSPKHPADAISFGGHWYKIYSIKMDWGAAKKRCAEMGGYLACVETYPERKWIAKFAKGKILWVGGKDTKKEGQPLWLNGKPFLFKVQDNQKSFDYIALMSDGRFMFTSEAAFRPKNKNLVGFICEWDK